jgi:hypothetical protein
MTDNDDLNIGQKPNDNSGSGGSKAGRAQDVRLENHDIQSSKPEVVASEDDGTDIQSVLVELFTIGVIVYIVFTLVELFFGVDIFFIP